jgi:DNA helicase-2/ATP-dependent DNA helicase PcrA
LKVTNILGLCQPGKKLAGWSVVQFGGQGGSPNHLNLMTFHSAKGLEFDVVFMLGLDQGIIPSYNENTPSSKREPRRLFYVGLTRARYEVHMLYSGWRDSPYGRKHDGPSEFLKEVRSSISSE